MLDPFRKLCAAVVVAGCLLPALTVACSRVPEASRPGSGAWTGGRKAFDLIAFGVAGAVVGALAWWTLTRPMPRLEEAAEAQARWCEAVPPRLVGPAIAASAGLSLLLELAVIRWHGSVFELFAYYKNLSLIACFLGLGLGYALARADRIPLALTPPLLAFQAGLLLLLRHGFGADRRSSLNWLPIREELSVWDEGGAYFWDYSAIYLLLGTAFALTTLAFLPIGQLCGRLMSRTETLRAYGLNLLGSLLGVGAMFVLSAAFTPPAVWFGIGLAGLLAFGVGRGDRIGAVAVGGALATTALLAWPVEFGWERIYSPYQLLERGPGENGLPLLRASGQYHQRIHNLSKAVTSTTLDPGILATAAYYDFPYRLLGKRPRNVLVVGAGTGNDVAAAIRAGAERISAVEIDPAILEIGRMYHPERPYQAPQVDVVVDDARSYLRTSDRTFDLIAYGLLDSVTLLSHGSNVRLDSFVYTIEGLRDARDRLKPGGLLSLSFSVVSPELGRKIYLMMTEAFDGRPPLCLQTRYNYDGSIFFLQRKGEDVTLPAGVEGFADVTAEFADPRLKADVSTDDWPFFYMIRRVYPTTYLPMAAMILGIGGVFVAKLARTRPTAADGGVFCLGAGFMLVQTKGITELGLAFGNTWRVVGMVIAAMLGFAYLANLAAAKGRFRNPIVPYLLLLASLGAGLAVARAGGLPPTGAGRFGTALLLTCPVFFSGLVFSTIAASEADLPRTLAANLLGALVGGLLEYNAMYFGFRSLYWVAIGLYGLAFVFTIARGRRDRVRVEAEEPASAVVP